LSGGPVLRLELRASRMLAGALLLVHAAAAASVLAVAPGIAGLGIAALLLLLGAVAAWDRALLRGRRSVRSLELSSDGTVTLGLADGRRVTGRLARRRHVNAWWVTLPLQGDRWRTVLVPADMLDPSSFRRLRQWGLWGRVADAPRQPYPGGARGA
jgi:hypothetical protein